MLSIQNLSKRFGGVKAVNDCSFEVGNGKITALIGPNGSGKTTIFNLISGVIPADSGEIFLNNKNITNWAPDEISNWGISRVFQQSRLFGNLTLKDNLLIAFDNEDTKFWKNFLGMNKLSFEQKSKVKQMLELTGLMEHASKPAKELSFGQKRLVEIARAIINPHSFLMLDEPVAGVTPPLRKKIADILLELKKAGETIFLIEHDMNFTLSISDEVIAMDAGQVIFQGAPEQVRKNKQVLEAYLGE